MIVRAEGKFPLPDEFEKSKLKGVVRLPRYAPRVTGSLELSETLKFSVTFD